jgi:hypothetical protein
MAASAGVLAVLASGCATMPTSGAVQQIRVDEGGNGQSQDNPQPIPVPPGPTWSPQHIVAGFVAASATFTNDSAVARKYLAPGTRWVPTGAATVVSPASVISPVSPPKNVAPPAGLPTQYVEYIGHRLARLTGNGQYLTTSSSRETDLFTLVKIAGQWRISRLPSSTSLILTKSDFQRDYQPRNLYFFAPSGRELVPDPVFFPQLGSAEPTGALVRALIQDPSGWLYGAAKTDFPAGTIPLGVQIIGTSAGTTAVVDLGGSAATASKPVLRQMAAQLVWTLTSSSYSPSAIRSVLLEVDHHPVLPPQLPHPNSGLVQAAAAGPVYYLDSVGDLMKLPDGALVSRQLLWPGADEGHLTTIAVAPGGAEIAGIVGGQNGCTVYSGVPRRGASLRSRTFSGAACTSLSWDDQGELWVAVGTHVWMLPPSGTAEIPVLTPAIPSSDTVTDLRVAPDGVRVAMIVRGKTGPGQVLLGAITATPKVGVGDNGPGPDEQVDIGQALQMQVIGPGVTDPTALSWYDADHVVVLGHSSGPQLWDVPLNGEAAELIATERGTDSITAAGPDLVVGTSAGEIMTLVPPGSLWQRVAVGSTPVYPG